MAAKIEVEKKRKKKNPNFRKLWGVPKEYIKKEGLSYIARASGLGKPF